MSSITTIHPNNSRLSNMSIEELLDELGRYAFIDIFNSDRDGTWSAKATMRIKTEGATFQVSSGFQHETAKQALIVLLELVKNAVSELGDRK